MTMLSSEALNSVMFGVSCIILIVLCVALLVIMDVVRHCSGGRMRGLIPVAVFGLFALISCLLDQDRSYGVAAYGSPWVAASQIMLLWTPHVLMVYYCMVVRKDLAERLKRVLIFDAGLAVYLMVLFFVLPKERVVTEVFSLFILTLSVLSVVVTLFIWHGGQEGYGRIYWESAALIALAVTGILRLAFRENGMYDGDIRTNTRLGGIGAFMMTMTVIQIYAMFMEFRVSAERSARELAKKTEELEQLMKVVDRTTRLEGASGENASDEDDGTAARRAQPPGDDATRRGSHASQAPDDLPSVEGVDWNIAWLYLRDRDMLTESVRTFYELIDTQADRLDEFYDGVLQQGGENELASYRIQVHGMKSSAATVGIMPLAGTAALLEFSARDADKEAILGMHSVFQKRWRSYKKKLKGVFGCGEDEAADKEIYDPDVVCAMLMLVKSAMEELDVDAADEAVEELGKYSYPDEAAEKLRALKAAVTDLDSDTAVENADLLACILGISL